MEQEHWHLSVVWVDGGREPQCKPNPAYPDGIDVEVPGPTGQSCFTRLAYPAKRCGYYEVRCAICRYRVAVTTAGRPDDPRSVRIGCLQLAGTT